MSEIELRESCVKCKSPLGIWQPYRIENEAFGFSITCDKCGNHMFKGEIINEQFARNCKNLLNKMETE